MLRVAADGHTILKGSRRWKAAKTLGLATVPCIISPVMDKLQIEIDVLEANRSREKTNEQKAREFRERLRIEKALARQRAGGNGHHVDESDVYDLAIRPLGWIRRAGEKAEAVLAYVEQTGDHSLLDVLNDKSVNAAYAAMKQKRDGVKVPPFVAQCANVWAFTRPTPGLGVEYPGCVPGDILRNLFWLYTREGDLVVDLFAGGGVTMDTVAWWNVEAKEKGSALWPLRELSYDLVPSRKGIQKRDASRPPHLPKAAKGAGLIFLDPPYWKQKRGDYSDDPTNLANLPLDEFHRTLAGILAACASVLRDGGHVALIIGATQSDGVFIDHSAFVMGSAGDVGASTGTAGALTLAQRVIVPYTTQQFSGADVAWAKRERKMLKGYRDLMVFGRMAG